MQWFDTRLRPIKFNPYMLILLWLSNTLALFHGQLSAICQYNALQSYIHRLRYCLLFHKVPMLLMTTNITEIIIRYAAMTGISTN